MFCKKYEILACLGVGSALPEYVCTAEALSVASSLVVCASRRAHDIKSTLLVFSEQIIVRRVIGNRESVHSRIKKKVMIIIKKEKHEKIVPA